MATIRRIDESDEELAERFVKEADDSHVYCRATKRHRYPLLLPRKGKSVKIPKGFSFEPVPGRAGVVEVTEVCEVCRRVRRTITSQHSFLTDRSRYRYEDPVGYAAPKGTGAALREGNLAARELERRLNEGGLFGMPED